MLPVYINAWSFSLWLSEDHFPHSIILPGGGCQQFWYNRIPTESSVIQGYANTGIRVNCKTLGIREVPYSHTESLEIKCATRATQNGLKISIHLQCV